MWRDQRVYVVGHDDKGVKLELSQLFLPETYGVNQQLGNISPAKVKRTNAALVKDAVHRYEGSSRGSG